MLMNASWLNDVPPKGPCAPNARGQRRAAKRSGRWSAMLDSPTLHRLPQNRFAWVLEGRQHVLRDLRDELLAPERIEDIVIDHPNVLDVERNILLVGRHEHHGLLKRVSQAQLVEHVRVSACQFRHENLCSLNARPHLVDDLACREHIVIGTNCA